MSRTPDAITPVEGYRVFAMFVPAALASPVRLYKWTPGENRAGCIHNRVVLSPHEPPGETCACGFYAVKAPEDLPARYWHRLLTDPESQPLRIAPLVLARVAMWGKVIPAASGYRGARAAIRCLYADPRHEEFRAQVEERARAYSVEVDQVHAGPIGRSWAYYTLGPVNQTFLVDGLTEEEKQKAARLLRTLAT